MAFANILQSAADHTNKLPYDKFRNKFILCLQSIHIQPVLMFSGIPASPPALILLSVDALAFKKTIYHIFSKPLIIRCNLCHGTYMFHCLIIYLAQLRKHPASYPVPRIVVLVVRGICTVGYVISFKVCLYLRPVA